SGLPGKKHYNYSDRFGARQLGLDWPAWPAWFGRSCAPQGGTHALSHGRIPHRRDRWLPLKCFKATLMIQTAHHLEADHVFPGGGDLGVYEITKSALVFSRQL